MPDPKASELDVKLWTPRRFRTLVGICIALGTLLRLESLGTPWILDDYMQLGMSSRVFWAERAAWDRYRFISGDPIETRHLMDSGALPWWTEPHLKLVMFRPIASLVGALELWLVGPSPVVSHAVSLLACALVVFAVALVYRRLLPCRTACIALPIYVLGRSHDIPVGWVANRAAIFAALFGALALHGHVRWRESGARSGLAQAVLCLSSSALSAEYGLATFGLFFAYEMFGSRPSRLRALLPAFAVGLCYVAAYRGLGFGTRGTSVYADPTTEPGRFLMTALTNVPLLGAEVLWPSPMRGATMVAGILAVALGISLLVPALSQKARRTVLGATIAGFIACLPLTVAAVPNPRLLEIPNIAFAGALAVLLDETADVTGRVRWFAVRLVTSVQLFLAPVVAWLEMHLTRTTSSYLYEEGAKMPLEGEANEDAILVAAPEIFSLHDPPMVRHLESKTMPRAWWVLSVADSAHRLERVAADTLELQVLGAGLFDTPNRDAYQPPKPPLAAGSVVDTGRLRVTVLAVGPAGPTRIRFRFPENLDAPNVTLLTAGANGYQRMTPPTIGQSVVLPKATLSPVVAPALRY